jgi:hypothetical protein
MGKNGIIPPQKLKYGEDNVIDIAESTGFSSLCVMETS